MFPEQPTPLIQQLRDRQCRSWRDGTPIPVETFLREHTELTSDTEGILILIYQEILLRERHGEQPQVHEYVSRFPQLTERLQKVFDVHAAFESEGLLAFHDMKLSVTPPAEDYDPYATRRDGAEEPTAPRVPPPDWPTLPGYEILGELGRGGAGVVYKARQRASPGSGSMRGPRKQRRRRSTGSSWNTSWRRPDRRGRTAGWARTRPCARPSTRPNRGSTPRFKVSP